MWWEKNGRVVNGEIAQKFCLCTVVSFSQNEKNFMAMIKLFKPWTTLVVDILKWSPLTYLALFFVRFRTLECISNICTFLQLFGPVIKPSYLWELGYHKWQSSPKCSPNLSFCTYDRVYPTNSEHYCYTPLYQKDTKQMQNRPMETAGVQTGFSYQF